MFAKCFHSVYGDCAFVSLEVCPDQPLCQVRLVFRTDDNQEVHFENLIDSEHYLQSEQLIAVLDQMKPAIVSMIEPDLQRALAAYQLPTRSAMVIPIYLDGRISRWVLVSGIAEHQFASVDLEQAVLLANLAGTYMARIEETEALARANSWIKKELNDIARIHGLLLPQEKVAIKGTSYASYFQSCDTAGGDYFDIVNLSDLIFKNAGDGKADSWGVIIADASGHGAAAAVEVAMFDAILRTYRAGQNDGPASVFNYTNHYFFTRKLRGSYITALIMSYDPQTATLTYANAGHPPALLLSPDGQLQVLQHADIPLGVEQEWQWQNMQISLEPGTLIVTYTDGITEAMSPDKEQFGMERLCNIVQQCSGVDDCIARVRAAIETHQGGGKQTDDHALLAFKIDG
jgi:sigma-B regulation protein RsbU (phosphoserine phosphatase)